MPNLPIYLRDPNEDPFLGEGEFSDQDQLNPSAPPTPLNAGSPVPGGMPITSPSGLPPLDASRYASAAQNVAKLQSAKPEAPSPKWWQRLAAAGAGGLAGYSNAAGRTKHPIDTEALGGSILGKPQYEKKLSDWTNKVQGAQALADAEKGSLDWASKLRKASSEESLQSAQARHADSQSGVENATAESIRAEGKNRYLKVGDGIFDKTLGDWKTPPTSKLDTMTIDPIWAKEHLPFLKPDLGGEFVVPIKGLDSIINNATKPPAAEKNLPIDQQFLEEYLQLHPGATKAQAITEYHKISQAPERPERPPQALMIGPDGKALVVRPGTQVPTGALTPSGQNTLNVPTAATRTMAEAAPKVMSLIDRSSALVDQQKASLGPLASRWNEFMAGKVGAPNPEFTQLRTNIGLLQTLLMRMHVGARGGQQIMEHFTDLLNSAKQSPENLQAAMGEIRAYAQEVAGSAPHAPEALHVAAPQVGAKQNPNPSGYVQGHVYGGLTYLGGDPNSPGSWKK